MRKLHDDNQAEHWEQGRRTLVRFHDVLRLFAATGLLAVLRPAAAACLIIVSTHALNTPSQAQTRRRTQAANAQSGSGERAGEEAAASLVRAVELLQAGRRDEAEPLVRRALSVEPRSADAHTLLGVILDQRGQTREAEAEYRAAIRLRPKSVPARANLGVLLAHEGRYDEAVAAFRAVLADAPGHPQATVNLGVALFN